MHKYIKVSCWKKCKPHIVGVMHKYTKVSYWKKCKPHIVGIMHKYIKEKSVNLTLCDAQILKYRAEKG